MPRWDREIELAGHLMDGFAERTGLTSGRPPRRYLWTDAFAVCNLLSLGHATGKDAYLDLAMHLVDQVHHVLGRYRDDDSRSGWLSGAADPDGEAHPTRGGLRIGKPLPERRDGEPIDEREEWDRDGQYFHYLTKWIHALDRTFCATDDPRYLVWARDLAQAAHRAFTYRPAEQATPRMVWKMSSDLSRVLVSSMGQHDPLDGLVTCAQLQATAARASSALAVPDLTDALLDFQAMCEGRDWLTLDPLGLGGLMTDAFRLEQISETGAFAGGELLESVLGRAFYGLIFYQRQAELHRPASMRLAFRELGLAIGLRAVDLLDRRLRRKPRRASVGSHARAQIESLARELPLGTAIQSFWLDPTNQQASTWSEHRDINEVMLATVLVPQGYLDLEPMTDLRPTQSLHPRKHAAHD
jgi:hypothetical protein